MKYSGAEIVINLLEKEGIRLIAGIPGGANLPIYDALSRSKIRHILSRHEQGAGFIAHGIARSTGKPAVCFATSGPGATNLVTAIADAKLDSIPIIAITGQVPTAYIGTDAFQEVDTYGITIPITKHNFLVRRAGELHRIIPEAFRIAGCGRPGPVVIDIPKDVQLERVEYDEFFSVEEKEEPPGLDLSAIEEAAEMINQAKRPLLCIGGGITNSSSDKLISRLAKRNSIPTTLTLMGLGCFPPEDPLYLGMLGMHGARYTNLILNQADLLLAFGIRFDDRATGDIAKFCPEARVIHIDIDHSEIDKIKESNLSIVGDIGSILEKLIPMILPRHRKDWIDQINKMKADYPFIMPPREEILHPLNLIRSIGDQVAPDTIIATDVGQHQMWVAQVYPFRSPRTLLTSGGLGTMGFGLPAAIGAALANPDKRIVCISGDGSFLMNIQELATLAELNVNITVVIMNNNHLGLVRQQQELFYQQNYFASKFSTTTDFQAIGKGFGIRSYCLKEEEDPSVVLTKALVEPGPAIVDIPIHFAENVFPMVPPGAGNHEMIGGE